MTSGEGHSSEDLAALLMRLEFQLMQPEFRRAREQVGSLLAEGFREFGSSGRAWSREAILELLAAETKYESPAMEEFTLVMLSSEAALVTYRAVRPGRASLRSSVWVRNGERWRMLFHQGTVCAQD